MKANPLIKLHELGQNIWLDDIRRKLITSGELQRLIDEDALCGMTSNPAIFEKAIAGSQDYDAAIRALAREGRSVDEIFQTLTTEDIQMAADVLRPTFDRLDGKDGFVSLEVNPHLAHDTTGTITEARRLWQALDRPNVLIKVPATKEGLPAIRQLTSDGMNVNVTLLFGLPRYREVAEAYIMGLEERVSRGESLASIASVASFFLSRIDVLVDPLIERAIQSRQLEGQMATGLLGQTAIASAKMAYQSYRQIFRSERFLHLAERGARAQRVLWASTSTKNPAYPDVKYVEPLIGPETINTMPEETLVAYRDHGNPAPRLSEHLEGAAEVLERLRRLGIVLDDVTQQLEDEGIEKFIKPYDSLLATLAMRRKAALDDVADRRAA